MSTKAEFCSTRRTLPSMKALCTPVWFSGALLVAGLGVMPSPGQAQELDRIIEFNTAFTRAQSKFIHEGVTDQDPGALVQIDPGTQNVLLRVHVELDRDQLQAVVGQAGLSITYLGPLRPEVGTVRTFYVQSADGPPVFRDSGDPAADNARYELEKKAWLIAHPEHHHQQAVEPER